MIWKDSDYLWHTLMLLFLLPYLAVLRDAYWQSWTPVLLWNRTVAAHCGSKKAQGKWERYRRRIMVHLERAWQIINWDSNWELRSSHWTGKVRSHTFRKTHKWNNGLSPSQRCLDCCWEALSTMLRASQLVREEVWIRAVNSRVFI